MNKIIFGIFAHPDDESFGPSGTLLQETLVGTELHLITLTNGAAGSNPDNDPNLGETRLKEWRKAGSLIGANSMQHLGYQDGQLNNQAMIEVGQKIVDIVNEFIDNSSNDTEIEFMSIDTNGVTGHIDHIVAARAALWAFYKLKERSGKITRIRLACISKEDSPTDNVNWLFMESGRSSDEINETIDARKLKRQITEIVKAHKSQRSDGDNYIKSRGDSLGIEHFIVKT